MKKVGLVGISMDLGAGTRGSKMGPAAIREAGIVGRLTSLGYDIEDVGDIVLTNTGQTPEQNPKLKHLDKVLEISEKVSTTVDRIIQNGQFPLILGGDHSISIGSIAGIAKHKKNLGVIWYDAHGDLNTDKTTPSGNIHGMPLAANLGFGDHSLTHIGGIAPKVKVENAVVIGARDLDAEERAFIREKGIRVFTMEEIDRRGMLSVMEEALRIVTNGTDGLHLSLDLDALDPFYAPGVGTPVQGGITYRETRLAMEMIAASGALTSAEFVEVNPFFDQNNRTAETAVALIASLLGEKLL